MATDKIIRWQVDGTNVRRAQDEINQNEEKANIRKRAYSKRDIEDIEKQIKLIKEKIKLEEDAARKKIQFQEQNLRTAEQLNRQEILERRSQAEGMTGSAKTRFLRETARIEREGKLSLSSEKIQLLEQKNAFNELKDTNKQQLKELNNIGSSIKGGGAGTGRFNVSNISQLISGGGISSLMVSGGAVVGAIITAGYMAARNYENSKTQFRVATQMSGEEYKNYIREFGSDRAAFHLGMSTTDFMKSQAMLTRAKGGNVSLNESYGLIGAGLSRGISDEQLQSLMNVTRYSGGRGVETIGLFEGYLRDSGKSLVQLPEVMSSYLRIATSILQRTGRLDEKGLQTIMTSIGKSYGVEGMNLDRMTAGIMGITSQSKNPVLLSMQMETLRAMNPNMDRWEMLKILEDPSRSPEYQKELISRMKTFGGGGVSTKVALLKQLKEFGLGTEDVDKIMSGELKIGDAIKKKPEELSKYYEGQANEVIGSTKTIETSFKNLGTVVGSGFSSVFGSLEKIVENTSGMNRKFTKSDVFQSRGGE